METFELDVSTGKFAYDQASDTATVTSPDGTTVATYVNSATQPAPAKTLTGLVANFSDSSSENFTPAA